MTRDLWLRTHPYLQPVADLESLVDATIANVVRDSAPLPHWDEYLPEFKAGVPLLMSSSGRFDVFPIEDALLGITRELLENPLPVMVADEIRVLHAELSRADSRSNVAWLSDANSFDSDQPRLLHFLGWAAMAHYLRPVVEEFARWRSEEQWLRKYCPTCGAPPVMAQLEAAESGQSRLFSCAYCKSRWLYQRTGCPFCTDEDDRRITVFTIEGERGLRIDACDACGGYLKTYRTEAERVENFFLAEWATLHLDIMARDRGLKRLAASRYEI